MQVYDITRKALRDLESRGIFRDDGAQGRGDYLVVICLARFAKSPRRIRILERFEDESSATFRACACQSVAESNAQWSDLHYVNCYEVWHVVKDYAPKTATPPELPKEDLEELDRIFPPMCEVKEICVLSIGYVVSADTDMVTSLCCAFDAEGVELLGEETKYPRRHDGTRHPFCEVIWEVCDGCDFHKLVRFMQRMGKLGCMVELGYRSVEVMR